MKKISIPADDRTPFVELDPDKRSIKLVGRSMPENSRGFYEPIFNWLRELAAESKKKTVSLTLELEYYNTSSSKCLLDLLKTIGSMKYDGWTTDATWLYYEDDDDMLSNGIEFQSMLNYDLKIAQTKKN